MVTADATSHVTTHTEAALTSPMYCEETMNAAGIPVFSNAAASGAAVVDRNRP